MSVHECNGQLAFRKNAVGGGWMSGLVRSSDAVADKVRASINSLTDSTIEIADSDWEPATTVLAASRIEQTEIVFQAHQRIAQDLIRKIKASADRWGSNPNYAEDVNSLTKAGVKLSNKVEVENEQHRTAATYVSDDSGFDFQEFQDFEACIEQAQRYVTSLEKQPELRTDEAIREARRMLSNAYKKLAPLMWKYRHNPWNTNGTCIKDTQPLRWVKQQELKLKPLQEYIDEVANQERTIAGGSGGPQPPLLKGLERRHGIKSGVRVVEMCIPLVALAGLMALAPSILS
jgi:hypothetical protein